MLDNGSLINMYRDEKAQVVDILGGDFPPFKEWKKEYMDEYHFSHASSSFVPMDVAVELTDAELAALPAG